MWCSHFNEVHSSIPVFTQTSTLIPSPPSLALSPPNLPVSSRWDSTWKVYQQVLEPSRAPMSRFPRQIFSPPSGHFSNNYTYVLSCFNHVQLCNPTDCSPSGFSVHGVLQARTLGWIAMPSSRGSSRPTDRTQISYIGRWILYHLNNQGSPDFSLTPASVFSLSLYLWCLL